jgi:kynureninase
MAALDASLDITLSAEIGTVRAASMALGDALIGHIERVCEDPELILASPRDAALRGGHVSFRHPHGYAVVQALALRNVIGDFRSPDLMRFGFNPLYNTREDAERAADALAGVLATRAWDLPEFMQRNRVT